MDRRSFLLVASGFLTFPRMLQGTPEPVASPATTNTRPDPIDLGSGITLIDYRLHPGPWPAMIGEIRNDGDKMIDAPTISAFYPTANGGNDFSWLSPVLATIPPKMASPIFGPVPGLKPPTIGDAQIQFSLCTVAKPGEYSLREEGYLFEVLPYDEIIESDYYRYRGYIYNHSLIPSSYVWITGIVRDLSGRVAGLTPSQVMVNLEADSRKGFTLSIQENSPQENPASPFELLEGALYKVDILPRSQRAPLRNGCDFGLPWD